LKLFMVSRIIINTMMITKILKLRYSIAANQLFSIISSDGWAATDAPIGAGPAESGLMKKEIAITVTIEAVRRTRVALGDSSPTFPE